MGKERMSEGKRREESGGAGRMDGQLPMVHSSVCERPVCPNLSSALWISHL